MKTKLLSKKNICAEKSHDPQRISEILNALDAVSVNESNYKILQDLMQTVEQNTYKRSIADLQAVYLFRFGYLTAQKEMQDKNIIRQL